ncbi:hypothetical protein [Enterovibrio norvegicus]|uniref:hypothetical protein n=1 Tax=Enterovibrio norvegicus TaxID=188144 RepID=UPI000C81AB34|nr:hypothetical protein [Enterovibrio norvegicus]PMH64498.1 hypothetical protein BCU62_15705 [Enterovibrio norvegicus]
MNTGSSSFALSNNDICAFKYSYVNVHDTEFLLLEDQCSWGAYTPINHAIRELFEYLMTHRFSFQKLAFKSNEKWSEIVFSNNHIQHIRDVRGAVTNCSLIEIPYLMINQRPRELLPNE